MTYVLPTRTPVQFCLQTSSAQSPALHIPPDSAVYISTPLNMPTNSISHTNPAPSAYTYPKTSRFLAFGELSTKYPARLGNSVPSTVSGWPKFTFEGSQPTLSTLTSLSLPHTASESYASESTLGSVENSPLQLESSLLAHRKELIVDEHVSVGEDPLKGGSLRLESYLPLNPVKHFVSSLAIIYHFHSSKF